MRPAIIMPQSVNVNLGLLVLTLSLMGCDTPPPESPEVTSNTRRNIGHEHKHVHGSGQVHDHDHANGFEGAHAHKHQHGHRHADPIHGGRLVQIDAVNAPAALSHYHAELMPVSDGQISFYLLSETTQGGFDELAVEAAPVRAVATEVEASLSSDEQIPTTQAGGIDVEFQPVGQQPQVSKFTCEIPGVVNAATSLQVTVPKLQIGNEDYTFSFLVVIDES